MGSRLARFDPLCLHFLLLLLLLFFFKFLIFFTHGAHTHVCMHARACVYALICRKLDLSSSFNYQTIILLIIFEIQGIFLPIVSYGQFKLKKYHFFWSNFFIYEPILKNEI